HHPAEGRERLVLGLLWQLLPEAVEAHAACQAARGRGGTGRSLSLRMAAALRCLDGAPGTSGPGATSPPRSLWGGRADGSKPHLGMSSAWQTSLFHLAR